MTQVEDSLLSQTKDAFGRINWWLMLIPVAGWVLAVGMFWVEVGIRPPKSAPAAVSAPARPATGPHAKVHDPGGNYNDPFFLSLQDYLDRDCVAPVIVGLAAAIYLLCAFRRRSLLFWLLGLLALAFALRELRDNETLEAAAASVCQWAGAAHGGKSGFTWGKFMTRWVYRFAAVLAIVGVVLFRRVNKALRADWRHTSWILATFAAYAVCLIVQRRAFKWGPSEQHIHRSLEECTETVAHAMFVVSSLMAAWHKPAPAADPIAAPPAA